MLPQPPCRGVMYVGGWDPGSHFPATMLTSCLPRTARVRFSRGQSCIAFMVFPLHNAPTAKNTRQLTSLRQRLQPLLAQSTAPCWLEGQQEQIRKQTSNEFLLSPLKPILTLQEPDRTSGWGREQQLQPPRLEQGPWQRQLHVPHNSRKKLPAKATCS